MKRVMILGAGGFLGRYAVREFAGAGYAVLGVDRGGSGGEFGGEPGVASGVEYRVLELGGGDEREEGLGEVLGWAREVEGGAG
jgi:nucleoside-diphosphate-sugar epimerase